MSTPTWFAEGICAQTDPDAFHPEKGGSCAAAKAVCNGDDDRPPCPVRGQCLAWALEHHERGIWGGTSERERRQLWAVVAA